LTGSPVGGGAVGSVGPVGSVVGGSVGFPESQAQRNATRESAVSTDSRDGFMECNRFLRGLYKVKPILLISRGC